MIKIQFKCPKKTAHNSIPFRSVYGSCFISIFIVIEQEDDGDADDNDDNNDGVSVRQANCIQKTTENQMELFGIWFWMSYRVGDWHKAGAGQKHR